MSPALHVSGLSRRYEGAAEEAVCDVDLDVARGEILALVGPSGCGKTTLLRLVAGLEALDAGRIVIADREMANGRQLVPTEQRGLALVFQEHALFPHLSVLRNVGFGLPRDRAESGAREMLALVGLEALADRAPHELSGGEQQRVAVARALAVRPALLLMDEPFNSLDASRRAVLRQDVRALLKQTGTAALLVTHDTEEAISVADRVAVMNAGRIEQVGTPHEIYTSPRTAFVADLICGANVLSAEARGEVANSILGPLQLDTPAEGPLRVAVRPDQVQIASTGAEARVDRVAYLGTCTHLTLAVDGQSVCARIPPTTSYAEGATVHLAVRGAVAVLR